MEEKYYKGLWIHYLLGQGTNGSRALVNKGLWCEDEMNHSIKHSINNAMHEYAMSGNVDNANTSISKDEKESTKVAKTAIHLSHNNMLDKKDWVNFKTLKDLKQALLDLEHPLHVTSIQTVFSSFDQLNIVEKGDINLVNASEHMDLLPKIMVIGEAPGEEEDKTGLPFVGASGQLLEQIFESIYLSRKTNIYISNVLPWRPPANRTPTEDEVDFFLPYLIQHIKIISPKLLILVGGTAYKALFKNESDYKSTTPISKIRGKFIMHPSLQIPCFVVFHPSYLLRASSAKRIMWHDMLLLQDWLQKQNF